jgi:hypothetical protein
VIRSAALLLVLLPEFFAALTVVAGGCVLTAFASLL